MISAWALDEPSEGGVVQRHGFHVQGWALPVGGRSVAEVVVRSGDLEMGKTRRFYARADLNSALHLHGDGRYAFAIDCRVPESLRCGEELTFSVFMTDTSGESHALGSRAVRLSPIDYRAVSHGYVFGEFTDVLRRNQIYASGPPSPLADGHCVELLKRYLAPGMRVLDVGCGIGAYAAPLSEHGIAWTGCEVRADFVEETRGKGLDAHLVADGRLPFPEDAFDAVIAIEVLEHVPDFDGLLRELRRVAPAAFFSVPNFEVIPMTAHFYALPWHMLEPDHHNFFTHASLTSTLLQHYEDVEVMEYGALPLLRAIDGLPLYNHLFAMAVRSRRANA